MWSYMITSTDGVVLHRSVPMVNVKFSQTMDGGTFSGDIPQRTFGTATTVQYTDLPGPELDEMILDDAILDPQIATMTRSQGRPVIVESDYEPWMRVVWPCWNGEPWCAYVITGNAGADPVFDETVTIQGVRADIAMMAMQDIRHNIQFVSVDQFRIYQDLFNYGRGLTTNYSTGPVTGSSARVPQGSWMRCTFPALSGVVRTRRIVPGNQEDGYPANARKIIETCLKQLTELEDGFERRVGASINVDGDPEMVVVLGYPRVGYNLPKVVFEYPSETVRTCTKAKDGSRFATRVDYIGQESNGSRPIGTALDRGALDAGYPLLARIMSASDVSEVSTLTAKARGKLTGKVPVSWQVTLDPLRQPVWGDYKLGDHILLRLRRTPVQDYTLRIIGLSVDVSDDGQAVVTPTLQSGDEVDVE